MDLMLCVLVCVCVCVCMCVCVCEREGDIPDRADPAAGNVVQQSKPDEWMMGVLRMTAEAALDEPQGSS